MHISEACRTLPRLASTMLVSAAVAVLAVPTAESAALAGHARQVAPTTPGTPADLYRGQQWTIGALHLPRAWKYSRGDGVTVAVLDTGVDGHQPDLVGRVVDGPDFTGQALKPGSRYWGRHGTAMASLIAGHGHGAGATAGVMGVAPDAKILSIRVTWEVTDPARSDHTQTDHSRDAIAKGIRYAVDHGAQVISMSLGGGNMFYSGNPLEEAAIKYAVGKGVVLVASAGNDGNTVNRRNYPAAYPGVIAVGAVDRAFKPAKFTNRHTYVSVGAPGVEIVSADVAGRGYILGTGTSSSAALIAGMGALVKARYPAMNPAEVKQAIEEGASHRPPDGRSTSVGTGVADAYGSLRAAARISRAEHADTNVTKPAPPASTSGTPARHGPDLVLIAVLSGGGALILLSLILGWRQRRRQHPDDHPAGPAGEDPGDTPEPAPAYSPASPPARSADESPWVRRPSETPPPPDASPWNRHPTQTHPPPPDASPWEHHPTQTHPPPPDASPWEHHPRDVPSPQSPPADASPWGSHPGEAPPPPPPPPREHPAAESAFRGQHADADPSSWEPGFGEEPPRASRPRRARGPVEAYEPYELPAWPPQTGNGNTNGVTEHLPSTTARHARPPDEHDPLGDDPIDSSSDVGTPLADESWESIRRGFDRLKEDAQNWESISKEDVTDTGRIPALDAFDETVNLPIVNPDDEDETPGGHGG